MAPGVNAIESVFIKACPDAVQISKMAPVVKTIFRLE